jgi:anaerobic ribonucleoside-triphosphate reductase
MSKISRLADKIQDRIKILNVADNETATKRIEICNSCEYLSTTTKRCQKCGCFMFAKTKLLFAQCPIDKW